MMAGFWFSLVVLAVVAMLFVALPLWRFRSTSSVASVEQRRQANRAAYEERLLEISHEVQDGLIAAEDVDRVRTELQRTFMRDMDALDKEQAAVGRLGGKALPLAFVLLVPVLGFGIYLERGSSQDLELPALMQRIGTAEDAESQTAMLAELAVVLQERFDREEDDLQNGYMLGTLYESLQRYDEAMAVFNTMLAQMDDGPDKATVQGQLARTQYQLAEGKLTPEVQQSIDAAIAMNPNEYYSMSILANDAFLREDLAAALGYWRRQLSAATPGSQEAEQLRQVITLVEQSLPQQTAQAGTESAAAAGSSLTVVIDLAPELKEQLGGKQSLFVYVRNPDLRPPLVAQNLGVPEFPFTITLDNSMSMTGMTLESAPTLIVGARLSASGTAIAASGDLQTVSEPFVLGELEGPVQLTINELVP
jgi:cytochrome c-type biogenesis protein CcmH